jgi:hypothetical protein
MSCPWILKPLKIDWKIKKTDLDRFFGLSRTVWWQLKNKFKEILKTIKPEKSSKNYWFIIFHLIFKF